MRRATAQQKKLYPESMHGELFRCNKFAGYDGRFCLAFSVIICGFGEQSVCKYDLVSVGWPAGFLDNTEICCQSVCARVCVCGG